MIDTPGHSNFVDEIASSIRAVDGAVVVVDAVEGVLLTATQTIQHLVKNRVPITYELSFCILRFGRKLMLGSDGIQCRGQQSRSINPRTSFTSWRCLLQTPSNYRRSEHRHLVSCTLTSYCS
jgi:hypothetical protein